MDEARVDRWLWSVRLYKTRGAATDACKGGHVRIDGKPAKPASPVTVGARVEARVHDRDRVLEVTRVIDKRVGAPLAVACYVDHSPPPPDDEGDPVFARPRGAGRPTKRERRQMDRFRGR